MILYVLAFHPLMLNLLRRFYIADILYVRIIKFAILLNKKMSTESRPDEEPEACNKQFKPTKLENNKFIELFNLIEKCTNYRNHCNKLDRKQ